MPVTGVATAQLRLDTSDLLRAPNAAQQAATGVERNLGRINAASNRAQQSFAGVAGAARSMAGAFGVSLGIAGVVQLGRMVVAADELATTYRRQSVAALHLAGSQQQLNSLLAAYEDATGGAVDRATALADVTKLMATGFADNGEELERFVTIARGASLAMGQSQEYIISQLQLALANQSTMRLDQLGIGVDEFTQRLQNLKEEDSSLSAEMRFQTTLLDMMEEKFSALAKSAAASATGAERLTREWKDLRLEVGKEIKPGVDQATNDLADFIVMIRKAIVEWSRFSAQMERSQAGSGFFGGLSQFLRGRGTELSVPSGTSRTGLRLAAGFPAQTMATAPRFDVGQKAAIVDRQRSLDDITRTAHRASLDATEQYESQRTSTIRSFEKTIAREAEDFGRQRARAEQTLQRAIADAQAEGAKQQIEIERNLAKRESDINKQFADRESDIREQVNTRLLDIEDDYQEARTRSMRDHRDNLLDAASNLDARAIYEEQRRFKRQQEDLLSARDKQTEQTQEGADEQLEQARETAEDQLAQAREAAGEQLELAKRNTRERVEEMRADLEERQRIEDEDRTVRLGRMEQDHNDQLDEQARQQGERLTQIADQAAEERTLLDEEFQQALNELGLRSERWTAAQDKLTERAIKSFDKWWEHVNREFKTPPLPATGGAARGLPEMSFQHGGLVPRDMLAYLHGGERVIPRGGAGGNSINIEAGAFQFSGVTGDPAEMTAAVEAAFASILGRMGGRA